MRPWILCVIVTAMMSLQISARALAALDGAQQQSLSNVSAYLKHVEENLKLAQDAAGPGDGVPPASKAKLAKLRLAQAEANLPPAVELIGKLPADDEGVKAAKVRADAAAQGIQKLNDRLAGKNAPASGEPANPASGDGSKPAGDAPKPAPAAAGKPLDYRQREQLKSAQFNLDEVEGNAAALQEMAAKFKAVADVNTIDYQDAARGMNTIANAQRKSGFVDAALKQLPADGAGVGETRTRLDAANKSVAASAEVITPINEKLKKLVDPASYPAVESDVKRLQQLAQMFGEPASLNARPTQAAAVLQQSDASLAEAKRIAETYGPLIRQQTELGKRIEGTGKYFAEKHTAFVATASAMKATLPAEVRADIAKAGEMADEATKNKTPAWFAGGIPQRVGEAEAKLALLQVIAPASCAAVAKEIAALKASLKQKEQSLEALIVEQNAPPPDRYSGGDKNQLAALATDAWKKQQPDAKVLAVHFPSANWERSTRWEYRNKTWYFIDTSWLQAQLVVVKDDRLAIIRPINLTKNHEKGDEVTASPLHAAGDPVIPQNYLLRSKLK